MSKEIKKFAVIDKLKERRTKFLNDVKNFLHEYSNVQKDFDLISSTNECEPIYGTDNSTGILLYQEAAAGAFTRVYLNNSGLVIHEITNWVDYEFYRSNAVRPRLKHKIYNFEQAAEKGLFNKGRQLGGITIDQLYTRMDEAMTSIESELNQG